MVTWPCRVLAGIMCVAAAGSGVSQRLKMWIAVGGMAYLTYIEVLAETGAQAWEPAW